MSSITVNTYARSINAYLHWSAETDAKCSPACKHLRIAKLKEPELALPTFAVDDIRKMMLYKTADRYEQRLQNLLLLLADTGCRITELLELRWQDIDFNNLLVTIRGKGDKSRTIPFSLEMRKRLLKMQDKDSVLVFATRNGTKLLRCNVLRYAKRWCRELNIVVPRRTLHSLRHTFASKWIQRGGSVPTLQRVLGHSDIATTMRYVHLQTADLLKAHEQLSLLGHARL
jgi:integrase/recombinase XerD